MDRAASSSRVRNSGRVKGRLGGAKSRGALMAPARELASQPARTAKRMNALSWLSRVPSVLGAQC